MAEGKYERRIVAFLDILGFSQLVEKADDPDWRAAIEDVVRTMRGTLSPNEAADLRLTQFSDCIVISATLTEYGCNLVMTSSIMLANNLLGRMVLLRGGIAVGNLVHDDDVMFGPGLLTALRKDQSGGTPKIALDQSLVDEIASWHNDFGLESLMWTDPYDLTRMLHTLFDYQAYTLEPIPGKVILDGPAKTLAGQIAWQCYGAGHVPSVKAKWLWMERYWNDAVTGSGILPRTDTFAEELRGRA